MSKRKLSRRDFLNLSAGAAAAGALAACGVQPTPEKVVETVVVEKEVEKEVVVTATPGPVATPMTLAIWTDRGEPQASIIGRYVEKYNEELEDAGIPVNFTFEIIHPGIEERLATSAAAGSGFPDLVFGNSAEGYLASYIEGGWVPPLNPILDELGYDWDDFLPRMRREVEGKNYWLIYSASSFLQYINLDHAEEAGLDVTKLPEDTATMLEWAEAMTQRDASGNVVRSGFLLTGSGGHPSAVWGNRLESLGGSFLTPDGMGFNFNNAQGLEAAEWIMRAFNDLKISDVNMSDRYKQWLTGGASIFWSGNWVIASSLPQVGLNFATTRMPSLNGKRAARCTGEAMFMFDNGDQDRMIEVGKLLKWFTEHLGEYNAEAGDICPTKSGSELEVYKTRPSAAFAEPAIAAYLEDFGFFTDFNPQGNQFNYYFGEVLTRNLDNVWQGIWTPQEGLDNLEKEAMEVLADSPSLKYDIV